MSAILIKTEQPFAHQLTRAFLQMATGVAQILSQEEKSSPQPKPVWTINCSSGAAIPIKDRLSEISENFDAVLRLCQSSQMTFYLLRAVETVKRHFPGRDVSIRAAQDPEGEGEWLDVDTALNDADADPLAAYGRCIDEWVRSTTPKARELIHFTFHFV